MNDLLKQKLDIAKRSGELCQQLEKLHGMRELAVRRKEHNHGIHIRLSLNGSDYLAFNSGEWKDDETILDAIIAYVDIRIAEHEAELNELIKILQ